MPFIKSILKSALGATVTGALALGTSSALAAHVSGVSFLEQPFTVNPQAVGEAQGPFTARFIDFSYRADADQQGIAGTNTANFQETGVGFFSTFQADLGVPINANTSGLNNTYKLYAMFTGTGTTSTSGAGIDGMFRTFDVTFRVDRNSDTNFVDNSIALTGTGDDVDVLRGTLRTGGFHVFGGLANGDFDVQFNATPVGGFLDGPAFASGTAIGDFNGVNTSLVGVVAPPGSFVRARIVGAGNTSLMGSSAPVPAPGSLALLGLGMLALVPIARRRRA